MFASVKLGLLASTVLRVLLLCRSELHASSAAIVAAPDAEKNIRGVAGSSRPSAEAMATTTSPPPPRFTMYNNVTVPMVGLGSASGVKYHHVVSAIEAGYRFVDTAQSHSWGYREEDVGRAVRDLQRRYEDRRRGVEDVVDDDDDDGGGDYVFVQTKIHPEDLGYESTKRMIRVSLDRLSSTTLDSVLIHKPRCWEGACSREPEGTWHDSWKALEEAVDSGIVRSVGMCDVDGRLLDELLNKRIGPHVIQNWFDPFHQDGAVRRRIERHNADHPDRRILYQGYSSLGTQWHHHRKYPDNPVLNDPTLTSIAARHGATVPQVVIQWATRSGVMALPASTSPDHQFSNLNSFHFELSEGDMSAIDGMDGSPPPRPGPKEEKDRNEVSLRFVNRAAGTVHAYWVPEGNAGEGDRVRVGEMVAPGDVLALTSYHGHAFVFRDGGDGGGGDDGRMLGRHVVDRSLGSEQNHEIEDRTEEL
jgi:diketogulonate reductase-like aldo/keto reductase